MSECECDTCLCWYVYENVLCIQITELIFTGYKVIKTISNNKKNKY